jgi:hypothetical protein
VIIGRRAFLGTSSLIHRSKCKKWHQFSRSTHRVGSVSAIFVFFSLCFLLNSRVQTCSTIADNQLFAIDLASIVRWDRRDTIVDWFEHWLLISFSSCVVHSECWHRWDQLSNEWDETNSIVVIDHFLEICNAMKTWNAIVQQAFTWIDNRKSPIAAWVDRKSFNGVSTHPKFYSFMSISNDKICLSTWGKWVDCYFSSTYFPTHRTTEMDQCEIFPVTETYVTCWVLSIVHRSSWQLRLFALFRTQCLCYSWIFCVSARFSLSLSLSLNHSFFYS